MFPMVKLTTKNKTIVAIPTPNEACKKASKTAGTAAMIDPIFGIKFSKKASAPHKIGKSTPKMANPPPTKTPVANWAKLYATCF